MWKRQLLFLCLAGLMAWSCWNEEVLPADASTELPAEVKYIALTFDDGPRRETTGKLLDGLKARGASATFFLVGEQIAGNEDLVERMEAEGHQIGNHTWSHQRLDQGADFQEELQRTEEALEELCGPGPYWLRPPYGQVGENSVIEVPMVKWSVDPRDWESRDAVKVTQAILENVQPDSIILLHDIFRKCFWGTVNLLIFQNDICKHIFCKVTCPLVLFCTEFPCRCRPATAPPICIHIFHAVHC